MPKKELNTVEELLHDPDFISYCEKPTVTLERIWKTWREQNPQHPDMWEEAKQLYLLVKQEKTMVVPVGIKEKTFQQILRRIGQDEQEMPKIGKRRGLKYLQYVAAALVLLIAGYWFLKPNDVDKQSIVRIPSTDRIKEINLPDGTKLTLNKGGAIQYTEKNGQRQLQIWGEAYVMVAKQIRSRGETRPFAVKLDDMEIQVLGTAFNVKNDTGKQHVVLMNGKVKVKPEHGEAVLMQPGEKVILREGKLEKYEVNSALYKAWLTENLPLDNTSLDEIIVWLEDAKGYQIEEHLIASERQKRMSGTLNLATDETLFKTLEGAFNIQITKNQQKLLLRGARTKK